MEYDNIAYELESKYDKRIEKKMQGKPFATKVIMSRTFSSAFMILQNLHGISFEQITLDLFYLCKDLKFKEIVLLFESELELACVNEEKFIFHLHSFYNNISSKIRKESKYQEFAEYIGVIIRLHREKKDSVNQKVMDAYLCLVLQMLEYLRPDKMKLDTCAYGVSIDGELLMGEYPLAYSDLPALELKEILRNNKLKSAEEYRQLISSLYEKQGLKVNSADDLEVLSQIQRIHAMTTTALFPFINEYTFDIVPINHYHSYVPPLRGHILDFDAQLSDIKERLKHRNQTLPTNGSLFKIEDSDNELNGALLKELVFHDSVYMLYRLDTDKGSMAGYYDTNEAFLFSITQDATENTSYMNLSMLILGMYATQVLNDFSFSDFENLFSIGGRSLSFKTYDRGGSLRSFYQEGVNSHRDLSKFKKEERYINVMIRNLPEGQKASEEAKSLAARYGYELGPNQTFVSPFVKQVFVKKTDDQKS